MGGHLQRGGAICSMTLIRELLSPRENDNKKADKLACKTIASCGSGPANPERGR